MMVPSLMSLAYRLEVHVVLLLVDGVYEGQDKAVLDQDVRREEEDPHPVGDGQRRPPLRNCHGRGVPHKTALSPCIQEVARVLSLCNGPPLHRLSSTAHLRSI